MCFQVLPFLMLQIVESEMPNSLNKATGRWFEYFIYLAVSSDNFDFPFKEPGLCGG